MSEGWRKRSGRRVMSEEWRKNIMSEREVGDEL